MKKKDAPKSVMTPEEVIAYKKKMIEQYEKQQKVSFCFYFFHKKYLNSLKKRKIKC